MSTHELARQQSSFSIRYKILLVISFLLFACVSAYLYLAVSFFKQDKVNLVFEYNKTSVERLAAEIDRFFSNSMDTVDLVAQSSLQKGQQILKGNSHIVLYGELSKDFDNLYIDKDFFKTYGLSSDQIKKEVFAQRKEIDSYVQKQKDSLWPFQNQWDIPLVSLGR
ncbi:MAG: hypothetical protein KDD50_08725, partial [Bdellovibrionales bacterium]|nr:hypothetical protein [Bdellovibrionales bacterium]